jgi:hypothetical protein
MVTNDAIEFRRLEIQNQLDSAKTEIERSWPSRTTSML